MESTAYFEKKISLSPTTIFNKVGRDKNLDELLLQQLKEKLEDKCSEHGFVLPGTLQLISRSMGYFEAGRFTGDAVFYVKAEGKVIYPADGIRVIGEVTRKNNMGLIVSYKNNSLRIQVPRDLHLGDDSDQFSAIQPGDFIEVELKKSLFQINDPYILTNGRFIRKVSSDAVAVQAVAEGEQEQEQSQDEEEGEEEDEEEGEEEDEESQEEEEEFEGSAETEETAGALASEEGSAEEASNESSVESSVPEDDNLSASEEATAAAATETVESTNAEAAASIPGFEDVVTTARLNRKNRKNLATVGVSS
uniref:S1 motif domain-containing protein n=1 Tax=viral metagenome TaxID=1070528 RepID=A0A6C0DJ34_9ZZZZ